MDLGNRYELGKGPCFETKNSARVSDLGKELRAGTSVRDKELGNRQRAESITWLKDQELGKRPRTELGWGPGRNRKSTCEALKLDSSLTR
jgi:hypothetical protein